MALGLLKMTFLDDILEVTMSIRTRDAKKKSPTPLSMFKHTVYSHNPLMDDKYIF